MNILYLTDTGDIIGGGEISLLGILKHIDKSCFKPYVVTPHEGSFTQKIKEMQISLHIIPLKKIKNP